MDSILDTLVQLASSLSPTAFLGVLSLVVGAVLTTIKIMNYFSSKKKKAGGILALLTGQAAVAVTEELTMQDVQKKLDILLSNIDTLATANDSDKISEKILFSLTEVKRDIAESAEQFEEHTANIISLRAEINDCFKAVLAEFADIKHYMKMHDVTVHQDSEAAKELQQRIHGIVVRAISQIEKADEFSRTTVPEFRSYHKELSKDVSDLSRDIALVERSIQNQINTSQAIKLR